MITDSKKKSLEHLPKVVVFSVGGGGADLQEVQTDGCSMKVRYRILCCGCSRG